MSSLRKSVLNLCLAIVVAVSASALAQQSGQGKVTGGVAIGTVKSISGNAIVLAADSGESVNVTVQDNARLLRIAPGETDLKNAAPLALSDIQTGDRIRLRGSFAPGSKTLVAVSVIAIKKTDVAQLQQKELQDWQKRGAGGLVKSVEPATSTVTITVASIGSAKELAIKTSPSTKVRRYAEDSVKFDEARPSTLSAVKAGDQLRARGNRNTEGTDMTAEEIVFGSFRNLAGLITSVDPVKNTITVNDLATKKAVTVRISKDSLMHKLPQMAATMIAFRLKGIPIPSAGGNGGGTGPRQRPAGATGEQPAAQGQSRSAEGGHRGGQGQGPGGQRAGGADLQQILNRMPTMQFADLQKGDAVMIVTTEGAANSDVTAITLLSGVEPILTAAPNGASSLLSPWNLGAGGADAEAAAP